LTHFGRGNSSGFAIGGRRLAGFMTILSRHASGQQERRQHGRYYQE
jgi:hypothetical protein